MRRNAALARQRLRARPADCRNSLLAWPPLSLTPTHPPDRLIHRSHPKRDATDVLQVVRRDRQIQKVHDAREKKKKKIKKATCTTYSSNATAAGLPSRQNRVAAAIASSPAATPSPAMSRGPVDAGAGVCLERSNNQGVIIIISHHDNASASNACEVDWLIWWFNWMLSDGRSNWLARSGWLVSLWGMMEKGNVLRM